MRGLINDYLNIKNKSRFAIMVNGDWGSGKTHYARNYLMNEINRLGSLKPLYVSVNGISSVEDFFKLLIATKIKGSNPKSTMNIAAGLIETALDISLKATGLFRLGTKDIKIDRKQLFNFNKSVIIIDDLERMMDQSLISSLMGQIHSFIIENESTKVIYVCDENKIESDKYRMAKEKYVGWTVSAKVDREAVVESILRTITSSQPELLLDDIDLYTDLIVELGINNFRTIEFFVEVLSNVIHRFKNVDVVTRRSLIYSILILCEESRSPGFDPKKDYPECLSKELRNHIDLGYDIDYFLTGAPENNPNSGGSRFKKYILRDEYDFELVLSNPIILDLILYKPYVNEELDDFIKELDERLLFKRVNETGKLLHSISTMGNVLSSTEEDYINTLQVLKTKFEQGELNTAEVILLLWHSSDLHSHQLIPEEVDLNTEGILESLGGNYNFEENYKGQNTSLIHVLDDIEIIPNELKSHIRQSYIEIQNATFVERIREGFLEDRATEDLPLQSFVTAFITISAEELTSKIDRVVVDVVSLDFVLSLLRNSVHWVLTTNTYKDETKNQLVELVEKLNIVLLHKDGLTSRKRLEWAITGIDKCLKAMEQEDISMIY